MMKIRAKIDPIVVGQRVRSLRALTGCTREIFEKNTGINAATLRIWECPTKKNHGLTIKGANRIINALQKMNIYCTSDWLFYGIGNGPITSNTTNSPLVSDDSLSQFIPDLLWEDEINIIREIEFFKRINKDATVISVTDDSMEPLYSIGDYVGGKKFFEEQILETLNHISIIELVDNTILIRKIKSGSTSGKYNLICLNIDTTSAQPILFDQLIISSAPIIWVRKKGIIHV